jgi:hypothetical protein
MEFRAFKILAATALLTTSMVTASAASAAAVVFGQTVDLTKATITSSNVTASGTAFTPTLSNSNELTISNGDSVDYTVTFAPGQALTLTGVFGLFQIGLISPNNIGITGNSSSTLRLFDTSGTTIATILVNGFTSTQPNIVGDTFGNLGVPISGTLGGFEFINPDITLTGTNQPLNGQVLSIGITGGSFQLTSVAAVPEPATWAMMLVGFFGIGATLRHQRRRRPILAQVA